MKNAQNITTPSASSRPAALPKESKDELEAPVTAVSSNGVTDYPSEPTDAIAKEEPYSTRRALKKIIREESNWSLKSISITALTGVSVAVISTQLTGVVSSMVLIAVMAFVTATVSELYRIFLGITGLGARRAAAKASQNLPLPPLAVWEKSSSETGETSASEPPQTVVESQPATAKPVSSIDSKTSSRFPVSEGSIAEEPVAARVKSRDSGDGHPLTAALTLVKSSYQLNETQKAITEKSHWKRFFYRLGNYAKANPFLWLVAIFASVAIATIATAYVVTNGEPQIVQTKTVQLQKTPLTTEEQSSLTNKIKSEVLQELPAPTKEATAPPSTTVIERVDEKDKARMSELSKEVERLQTELAKARQAQSQSEESAKATQAGLQEKLEALEAERTELAKRLEGLEAKVDQLLQSNSSAIAQETKSEQSTGSPTADALR